MPDFTMAVHMFIHLPGVVIEPKLSKSFVKALCIREIFGCFFQLPGERSLSVSVESSL